MDLFDSFDSGFLVICGTAMVRREIQAGIIPSSGYCGSPLDLVCCRPILQQEEDIA